MRRIPGKKTVQHWLDGRTDVSIAENPDSQCVGKTALSGPSNDRDREVRAVIPRQCSDGAAESGPARRTRMAIHRPSIQP